MISYTCDSVSWMTTFQWFCKSCYINLGIPRVYHPGRVAIHLSESQEIITSILLIPNFAQFCDCVNVIAVHNLTFLTVINVTVLFLTQH